MTFQMMLEEEREEAWEEGFAEGMEKAMLAAIRSMMKYLKCSEARPWSFWKSRREIRRNMPRCCSRERKTSAPQQTAVGSPCFLELPAAVFL